MIVALDGPAGVGKSSIARKIADTWQFFNLNSGSFYRALTFHFIEEKISPESIEEIIGASDRAELDIIKGALHLNGRNLESKLRTDRVEKHVAQLSSIPEIREIVNKKLRIIGRSMNIVAEGRDMTTVVFPKAEVKFFLDAAIEIRAERRLKQGSSQLNLDQIIKTITERDDIDRNKKTGSLKIADDAIYLDTSHLTIDEVCEKVSFEIRSITDSRRL